MNNKNFTDISEYILHNSNNYKPNITNSVHEVINVFVTIIIEYIKLITDKITMKKPIYYKFIFERGIETLTNIFSIIFYCTKNIELTHYHCQKACYFYVEYIEQISGDNIDYLQLTSRDAILFVYKKTIFELNNEYRKELPDLNQEEKNTLSYIDNLIHIYQHIISFIINNNELKYDNKLEYINSCCNYIQKLNETINKCKIKQIQIEYIYLFLDMIVNKNIIIKNYFLCIETFIKKINHQKKKINEKIFISKLYDENIDKYIAENNYISMIDWIFIE